MSISFQELEKSAKKIQDVKHLEQTVEINGVKVTFRALDQEEEVEVTEYVSQLAEKFESLESSLASNTAMGLAMRTGFLAYSIVELDNHDLRHVEYIQISEEDVVSKKEALAKLMVENWDSDFHMRLYKMFMVFAMEQSIQLMEKIKVDYKSLDDQLEYHKQRAEDIKGRLEALRGKTIKEKLMVEEDSEEGTEEMKGDKEVEIPVSSDEKPKVTLNKRPGASETEKQDLLNPKPTEQENWEDIESSFLSDDPNALEAEARRIAMIQHQARQRQEEQHRQKQQSTSPTLNKGLPEIPIRKPVSNHENQQTTSMPVANLKSAFQTGQKIVMREPEESLDQPQDELHENKPPVRRGGALNPNFKPRK